MWARFGLWFLPWSHLPFSHSQSVSCLNVLYNLLITKHVLTSWACLLSDKAIVAICWVIKHLCYNLPLAKRQASGLPTLGSIQGQILLILPFHSFALLPTRLPCSEKPGKTCCLLVCCLEPCAVVLFSGCSSHRVCYPLSVRVCLPFFSWWGSCFIYLISPVTKCRAYIWRSFIYIH